MDLRKYIREMVESELAEMARISTNIKLGDPEKVAAAKEAYAGTWYADLIDYVEEAGDVGIPQPELARMLGKSGMQAINPKVRDFVEAGILTKGELSMAKKEKPETTGIKGRPTSEKTLMVKAIGSKMVADDNYQPTEDELEMLGAETIERIRKKVKGLVKRGRKPGAAKAKDGMVAAMKNIMDTTDEDGDGDVDDEDLEIEDINESFIRMQKLAGLITENEFKKKLEEVAYVDGKPFTPSPRTSPAGRPIKYTEEEKKQALELRKKIIDNVDYKLTPEEEKLVAKIGFDINLLKSNIRRARR